LDKVLELRTVFHGIVLIRQQEVGEVLSSLEKGSLFEEMAQKEDPTEMVKVCYHSIIQNSSFKDSPRVHSSICLEKSIHFPLAVRLKFSFTIGRG